MISWYALALICDKQIHGKLSVQGFGRALEGFIVGCQKASPAGTLESATLESARQLCLVALRASPGELGLNFYVDVQELYGVAIRLAETTGVANLPL